MRHSFRLSLMIGIAAGALMMVAQDRGYSQSADPNAAPNPYRMLDSWGHLPDGRKFGGVIKAQVDHSDGKSIWVFDRCGGSECTDSTLAPLMKFDASGRLIHAIGAGLFVVSHALYVDRDENIWAGDQIAKNGKGADLFKLSPDGKVLMTIGKPGMPGDGPGYLSAVSAVVVAPNGDFYVADGHGTGTNDRIVKFAKDGTFITTWGKHGKAQGEFDTPHGIALDSTGKVYVGDRVNNRIQIFSPDGKFLAEWKQFGRPSDVTIDKNDVMYVPDAQSTDKTNPGFRQGIRIGSVKDGKVTAFIPQTDPVVGAPEGLGVDDDGNIYAAYQSQGMVRKFVKS
ncbi:MAG TPA: peptidyl-alpha-hydroxyglycine alpha-amidating lyase family protein [Xanthobacteraceae bacterium]|nr:peptidyl-alpha-hydroxyglycine alpha-amidating lyase family protein [Xanthobacteraceae bacterium]